VHTLEVGDLGLIACLDQRLKTSFDQRRNATAEDCLLAEEVGLSFLGEGRLDYASPRAAYALA